MMLMLKKSVSEFAHGLLLYGIASDIPEGAQYKDNACDGDGGKHGCQYHDAACHGDIVVHLNRYYTEYYRSKGYDFDITSSTRTDQAYNPSGSVFENISLLADRLFNSYIRREDNVEPLYALYCEVRQG